MAFRAFQSFACIFWRASEKNRLNCKSKLLSHEDFDTAAAVINVELVLISVRVLLDCLEVKLCIYFELLTAGRQRQQHSTRANGCRYTISPSPPHHLRRGRYCCVIAMPATPIPVPTPILTHSYKRIPIPKSYSLQYQLQYPQQPCLLVTFFSFFMIDVSARRMQPSTNKQRRQVHWTKILSNR